MKKTGTTPLRRSICPIANALDVVGDKWTLLIVRDLLFNDNHRYGDFLAASEGITTNILADRLKRLEAHGLVEKKPYHHHPIRYEYHLTPKGADLLPVLHALVRWAQQHIPGTALAPPQ